MVSRTPQIKAKISFDNKITKNSIEFLLDSGASFSCISQSLSDKLRNQIDIPVLSQKRPSPMSASSNILQPNAETEFDLLFTNENINLKIKKVRFSVFQRLNFSGIIGYEVLRKLDMRINPKGSAVSLHSQWFELTGETIDPNVVNFYSLNFSGDLSYDIYQVGILNLKTAEPHQEASSKTLEFLTTFDSGNPVTGDIDIFLTFCTTKLYGGIKNLVLPNLNDISSPKIESKIGQNLTIFPAKSILRGSWCLDGITSPVNIKNRQLIDKNFTEVCLKRSDLPEHQKTKLRELLLKFRHIFSSNSTDIGLYKDEDFSVELKNDEELPPYIKPRSVPFAAEEFVKTELKSLVEKGIFEPSPKGSSCNSPVHIVTTVKNGVKKHRLTVDYSVLNKYIKPNTFPIPRIKDVLDRLSGAKIFSNLDLRSGFWNLKLDEKSRDLLSFSINSKQYRPIRLPMGLKVSPSLFQRVMMTILNEYLDDFCVCYLDDCLIFSKSETDHLKHINLVLKAFEKSGILLNHEKCIFGASHLKYLGFEVSSKGWRPLPDRIKSIKNFVQPKDQKSLKRFIGSVSFLSHFIPALQYHLQPLHAISGSKSKFKWTNEHDDCFNKIKDMICNAVMMSLPDSDPRRFLFLTTDASNRGFGSLIPME